MHVCHYQKMLLHIFFHMLAVAEILSAVSASAKCSFTSLPWPFTSVCFSNTLLHIFAPAKHHPTQMTFHRNLKFPLHTSLFTKIEIVPGHRNTLWGWLWPLDLPTICSSSEQKLAVNEVYILVILYKRHKGLEFHLKIWKPRLGRFWAILNYIQTIGPMLHAV